MHRIVAAVDLPSLVMIAAAMLALVRPRGLSRASRLARGFVFLGLGPALIASVLVILEHATGREFVIDAFILPALDPEAGAASHVGVLLALSYGLVSGALLLRLRASRPKDDPAEFMAVVGAITSTMVVFDHFENGLLKQGANGGQTLVAALTALLLAGGVLISRRGGTLAKIVAENAITARLMRPLLVITAIIPIATNHFTRLAVQLRLWSGETAAALDTLACTIALLAVTMVIGRAVARTESERESAAALLRLQIARMPVACILRDASLAIQSWNPAAEKMFGYTESEMVGRTTDVLLEDSYRGTVETIRQRVLEGESNSNSVVVNVRKDGQPITCRWSNAPLLAKDGKVFAVLTMVEDITAEERARTELQESEMRYRLLVDHSPEGILVRSGQVIVFANRAASKILGIESQITLPFGLLDMIHPDDRERVRTKIAMLDTVRRPMPSADYRLVRADGRVIEVEAVSIPIIWEGAPASQIIFRDVTEQNASRRELKLSEERYRRVVESTNEGLLVLDRSGVIEFANEQMCRILGRQQAELIGQYGPSQIASGDSLADLEQRRNRRRYGVAEQYEAVLQRKSGQLFYALVSAAPLFADETFIGSVALIYDIHDRKLAEQKLRESEERYRDLLDSMPNFIFSVDRENRYTAVNLAACRAFGRDAEAVIGRTPVDLGFPEAVASQWSAEHQKVISSGESRAHETTVELPDGRTIVTRSFLSPIRDEHGEIVGVSGIALDITDQKRAEGAVQFLLRAVEQIDEVIFTTDTDGTITYVNPAFEKLYGYSRDEVVGGSPRLLNSAAQPRETYKRLWQEIKAGRTFRDEFYNKTKDGAFVRVDVSVGPVFDDAGHITGFMAIQRDVTAARLADEQRRRVDERLSRMAKMEALGTLAGGIAHDFNNILAIVMSHASVAERRRDDTERFSAATATIKQAVKRGAALSRQILTIARRADVKMEPVDIGSVVLELSSMISETFPRSIRINLDLEPDLPRITGDAAQIHQSLLNLCVNARDAMPAGGMLTIAASNVSCQSLAGSFPDARACDHVCIAVIDEGTGMDERTCTRIFEPFFTTKEKGQGTGLGLALVYGVVKSHGGVVDVKSSVGHGTEFRLYLPVGSAGLASLEAQPATRGSHRTGTLLAVDDEPAILTAVTDSMRAEGYRVLTAADADQALASCEQYGQSLDLIVTDLGLPGISTSELLPAIRRRLPRVPIIAMTGYVDLHGNESADAAGVKFVLQKPFEMDVLLARVRETLDAIPISPRRDPGWEPFESDALS